MNKTLFPDIIFNQYPSGQTSFETRLSDPSQAQQAASFNQMLQRISTALSSQSSLVVVFVGGHSDRVDDSSLDIVQKKTKEFEASLQRCESVREYILSNISAMNSLTVDQIKQSPNFAMRLAPFGSGMLIHNSLALTNQQRLENRRVEIIHYEFTL